MKGCLMTYCRQYMSRLISIFILLGIAAAITPALYAAQTISADNPAFHYAGRVDDTDPSNVHLSWPATRIEIQFSGSELEILLSEQSDVNKYNILIDGQVIETITTQSGTDRHQISGSLSSGNHSLTIFKITESAESHSTFSGIVIADGASVAAVQKNPSRKIEFIGDSHTAGFALGGDWGLDDASKSYAVPASEDLNAEYRLIAISGMGIVRNYGEDGATSDATIPDYFMRTSVNEPFPQWDFSEWKPDIVVVNAGVNDFAEINDPGATVASDQNFTDGYRDFLTTIRTAYPGVQLVLVSPYDRCGSGTHAKEVIDAVYDAEVNSGFTDVHSFTYPNYHRDKFEVCHPSVSYNAEIAEALVAVINSIEVNVRYPYRVAGGYEAMFSSRLDRSRNTLILADANTGIRSLELVRGDGSIVRSWHDVRPSQALTIPSPATGTYFCRYELSNGYNGVSVIAAVR
ncbi:MAG: hypothetical protein GF401_03305 [Chitinivibrionales bacterium]|nr:hypothetical protein [Chitinivibrionales bacterium]